MEICTSCSGFTDTYRKKENSGIGGYIIIDLDAKAFFRLLDSYLAPSASEDKLIEEFRILTGLNLGKRMLNVKPKGPEETKFCSPISADKS